MKILVAEDNQFYRLALEATLAGWGYEVVAVADGDAAWRTLQADDAPKLAILDWMMPGPDGLEVCRRLRARPTEEPTYVIILTARDGKEDIITALEGGADDYVTKPFNRDELRARLQVGLRIVGLQRSLAERVHQLEEALRVAQKMEAIGRLAGGVAHDFNNLLTIILGGSEIVLSELPPEHPRRDMARMVRDAGERGAGLTRQLLAFSRKQVPAPVVLNLNELVANVRKLLGRLLGEDVRLETRLAPALHAVTADPGQLEQVLMNLAVNARDAMPQGGLLTIATANAEVGTNGAARPSALPPGSYVLLTVSDTGCGMDEATRAHLFEPFFTTKEMGRGTGMGLATVSGIVQQAGGVIQVDSTPGRGTTFRIYLPRSEREAPAGVPAAPPAGGRGRQETVLLVEDEDPVRVTTRLVLQRHNYEVLEARDGREALRIAAQHPAPIHLLLTDVVMPDVSGRQLADALSPRRPEMKVLFMSGYTDDAIVRHRVLEEGAPLLQKPFTLDGLARKVREVLDQ